MVVVDSADSIAVVQQVIGSQQVVRRALDLISYMHGIVNRTSNLRYYVWHNPVPLVPLVQTDTAEWYGSATENSMGNSKIGNRALGTPESCTRHELSVQLYRSPPDPISQSRRVVCA
jgi:hypothetical protein